ncbi:MAG: hypothetical protein J7K33_08735 [Candidatus Marinimicrobia bacterium]|nr:hypothetical protein [Candidatus Neomarinimicrobiota bacterium]
MGFNRHRFIEEYVKPERSTKESLEELKSATSGGKLSKSDAFDILIQAEKRDSSAFWSWEVAEVLYELDKKRFIKILPDIAKGKTYSRPLSRIGSQLQEKFFTQILPLLPEEVQESCIEDILKDLVRKDKLEVSVTIDSLIRAFHQLGNDKRERIRKEVQKEILDFHGVIYELEFISRYMKAPYGLNVRWKRVLRVPLSNEAIEVFKETLRFIEILFPFSLLYLYLNEVVRVLGFQPPEPLYITLDYWTAPVDLKGNVLVPKAPETDILPSERREEIMVKDYLGVFFWDSKREAPHILFRIIRIADCAKQLNFNFWDLLDLVFIHEFAHCVHLVGRDADGTVFPPCNDEKLIELVAQIVTWKVVQNTRLKDTFEKLSKHQPKEYQTWEYIKDCSMEEFRALLINMRRPVPPRYYEVKKRWSNLPVL